MTNFKSIGAEYTDEYSNSEDAWEFAFSNDRRVIDALTNNTPDERAEAADEFGTGFTDAYDAQPPTADADADAEKQLAASAFTGDDGYDWLTDGADDSYLAALNEEGVKAYVIDYGDIIWGGDAHLPRFEELTVSEFIKASDYDAAVTAVTEAVQNAQGRTKEKKMDGAKTITAQKLYDWRAETSAVSGTDMHLFFAAVCGYLTPSGNDEISIERIEEVAKGNYTRLEELQHIANNCCTLESETARIVLAALAALSKHEKENKPKFLSGTVQIDADLKNPPLLEGGIPAPRTWCQVLSDDTNNGLGYDVDYTPFSSLGWIFNAANVCRAEKNGTYATRGAAWLAAEAFNTSEAARQRHLQG